MNVGEIYVDDVLISDVIDLQERQVPAYKLARKIADVLSRDYAQARWVRVFTPSKAHPDLLMNFQYRITVCSSGGDGETCIFSGQLVEGSAANAEQLGEHLARKFQREFIRNAGTPPKD